MPYRSEKAMEGLVSRISATLPGCMFILSALENKTNPVFSGSTFHRNFLNQGSLVVCFCWVLSWYVVVGPVRWEWGPVSLAQQNSWFRSKHQILRRILIFPGSLLRRHYENLKVFKKGHPSTDFGGEFWESKGNHPSFQWIAANCCFVSLTPFGGMSMVTDWVLQKSGYGSNFWVLRDWTTNSWVHAQSPSHWIRFQLALPFRSTLPFLPDAVSHGFGSTVGRYLSEIDWRGNWGGWIDSQKTARR